MVVGWGAIYNVGFIWPQVDLFVDHKLRKTLHFFGLWSYCEINWIFGRWKWTINALAIKVGSVVRIFSMQQAPLDYFLLSRVQTLPKVSILSLKSTSLGLSWSTLVAVVVHYLANFLFKRNLSDKKSPWLGIEAGSFNSPPVHFIQWATEP